MRELGLESAARFVSKVECSELTVLSVKKELRAMISWPVAL